MILLQYFMICTRNKSLLGLMSFHTILRRTLVQNQSQKLCVHMCVCVLGGGGGQLFGKEVSYPSLTFVNFSYVWQQQLCVRVMPLHIECDSVINDGLANYSWRIQTMQYHLGKHGEKRRGKFNQSLVTSVAFQWPPACIRAWWSRNVAHKCYPYFDPISIL